MRGPFFASSCTISCTISCTFFYVICTISCTYWAISCTILCTIYSVHVHFSLHHTFDFCTCTFLDRLFCTCTKSYVQKILTNVQNYVQNLRSYVHFFMIYVQAEGVPLIRPRDAYMRQKNLKCTQNCPKSDNFDLPGSHWLIAKCVSW